jgi:transposase InsO family protein
MIDSGAQGNYISPNLVNKLKLPWKKKDEPYRLRTIDGSLIDYGQGLVDMETAPLHILIGGQSHTMTLDITEISSHGIVLGIPWLRASNPRVNWKTGQLQWDTPRRDLASTESRPCGDKPASISRRALMICYAAADTEARSASLRAIPAEYRRYDKLFKPELETGLPEHSRWDHEINLQPGKEPGFHKIYPLNDIQLKALREYLDENLKKGYIRPSSSPAGYPIIFVPKKNGKLRLCVDYRQLNSITIKDRGPLPLITELRDRLYKALWFTTLDLKGAYNLIRVKKGDEWKTAFRTRMGQYEYLVMPFGLTNAPATFQRMINEVLRKYLDDFVVAYLDDILIFSETLDQHKKHVHLVLQALQDAKLLVEPEKCEFHKQTVKFLGYEISPGQLKMDPDKLKAIREWPQPTTVKEVRAFLGFANFYRKFVAGYGGIAIPLTNLTKKDQEFRWTPEANASFEEIKKRLLEEPILVNADPEKPYEVETDASDWALGGQLGQRDEQGRLHPVAFYSKKLHGPELNYAIHDKELMAIIEAFKEWKHYLSGAAHKVKVYTDHKNLTSFTTTKDLNKRQIRWHEFLTDFNFEIIYRKGSENGRADALSRREDLKPEKEPHSATVLRTNQEGNLELDTQEINATWTVEPDPQWEEKIRDLNPGHTLPLYNGKILVPGYLQKQLIKEIHEHPLHGHQGVYKTTKRIQRTYDFPGLSKLVKEVIGECDTCHKAKASRHQPYGLLQAITLPTSPWEVVAMDFIVKLPPSKEPMTSTTYDSIWVVVDKLTKYAYFIPYREASTAEEMAYAFLRVVASQHGLPKELITDRDKLFTSKFWTTLMKHLDVKLKLSTAFHPQTDGQTERTNQTLEQYLRCYVNHQQDDWVKWLPIAQWAYNSATIEGTSTTPFENNYGYNPTMREGTSVPGPPQALRTSTELKKLHQHLHDELTFLNARMSHYANKKRLKGPTLQEEDKVYLLRRNIKTKRPSDKLDWKKIGPFKIKQKLSDFNYELQLPTKARIHPIFHVSLLEPAPRQAKLATDVEIEPTQEYEVERILGHKEEKGKHLYLVKWKGYDDSENTWEPEAHLQNSQQLLQEFRSTVASSRRESKATAPRRHGLRSSPK